jgi:hypothetical protein
MMSEEKFKEAMASAISTLNDQGHVSRLVLPGFDSWKRRVEDRVEKDQVIRRLRRLREVGEIEEWQYVHRFNLRFCKIVTIVE